MGPSSCIKSMLRVRNIRIIGSIALIEKYVLFPSGPEVDNLWPTSCSPKALAVPHRSLSPSYFLPIVDDLLSSICSVAIRRFKDRCS
jgi:hypothetical protein